MKLFNTKRVFVFDTETTGLFPDHISLANIYHNQYDYNEASIMLSTAYHLMDLHYTDDNRLIGTENVLIATSDTVINWDIDIPAESTKVHGLTKEKCAEIGLSPANALHTVFLDLSTCDIMTAHNLNFDARVLGHAVNYAHSIGLLTDKDRKSYFDILYSKEAVCTAQITCMLITTRVTDNYGRSELQFARMKLKDLHKLYFGIEHDAQHTAIADTNALLGCFNVIVQKYWDILNLNEAPEDAIKKFNWHAIEKYKQSAIQFGDKLLPDWTARRQYASILLNYQRGTLISIKRQSLLFGTFLGRPIL